MNILAIPFHQYMGIKKSTKQDFLLMLNIKNELKNHLETVHASAQIALAEATSGQFLFVQFKDIRDQVVPVIRRTEVKYHRPASGCLYSKSEFFEGEKKALLTEFKVKNRFITKVRVKVFDDQSNLIATAVFEWFITKK